MQDDNLNFGLENYMDTLPSMVDFHGTDSPTFTFNRPIYHSPSTETPAIESTTNQNSLSPNKESSPLIGRKRSIHSPIKIDIDSSSSLLKSNSSPLAAFTSNLQSSTKKPPIVGLTGQSRGHESLSGKELWKTIPKIRNVRRKKSLHAYESKSSKCIYYISPSGKSNNQEKMFRMSLLVYKL